MFSDLTHRWRQVARDAELLDHMSHALNSFGSDGQFVAVELWRSGGLQFHRAEQQRDAHYIGPHRDA